MAFHGAIGIAVTVGAVPQPVTVHRTMAVAITMAITMTVMIAGAATMTVVIALHAHAYTRTLPQRAARQTTAKLSLQVLRCLSTAPGADAGTTYSMPILVT